MKKILLLSIASLAMLMADFTLEGDKLTPVSETITTVTDPTSPTEPVNTTPTEPVSITGIIPNSIDLIWEDSFGPNTGDPSACNSSWGQYRVVTSSFPINGSFAKLLEWYELTEEGHPGVSCSERISTSTNTLVEYGRMAAWIYYEVGGWTLIRDSISHNGTMPGGGSNYPAVGPFGDGTNHRGCSQYDAIRASNSGYTVFKGTRDDGLGVYKPDYYWDYHGWAQGHIIDYSRRPKALLVTQYARLIVDNPNLPDDRDNARFVLHVAADKYQLTGSSQGEIGMGRWKRITKDWQPVNFLTGGWTKEQFMATNPPLISTPR